MSELIAKIWVEALIRRAELAFAAAYVIRHGDEKAGAVLVKVVKSRADAALFVPVRDRDGERVWQVFRNGNASEQDIDAYCRKRIDDDPDIWVIEIEDRDGRHFLTEPVEKS